jgi:hypothetical protein
MKLTLERFGGVAGMPAKPVVVDTAALASSEAARLEALAKRALACTKAGGRRAAQAKPDAFAYELTIDDGGCSRVLAFDFDDATDAVKELVTAVRTQAKRAPA